MVDINRYTITNYTHISKDYGELIHAKSTLRLSAL